MCQSDKKGKLTYKYPNLCQHITEVEAAATGELCGGSGIWDTYDLIINENTQNLTLTLEKTLFLYARQNLVDINAVIKDMTVTRILKDEKTSTISFIANTGGLLGLCVGLSSVSIFEIIHHIIKFIISKIK